MGLRDVLKAVLTIATAGVVASARQDIIDLPLGFFPEGITLAKGWTVYVGSFDDGSIWMGDLNTGEGEVVISDVGSHAAGLDYDRRSGYLFVAGGFAGTARVYDTSDFSLVADFGLMAGSNVPSIVNDVIVTRTAAFFTDSSQAQLYKVPLKPYSGKLEDGEDTVAAILPFSSEFTFVEGEINSNGIEVTDDGETLIVVNMVAGELFTVDPTSGESAKVDLGGVLVHGDGLVLRQNTLWIVENTVAAGDHVYITEVSLSDDLSCGSVLPRVLVNEYFDDPATTVRKGNSFYTVMSKFGVAAEDIATTAYEIVRTDRDSGEYACPTVDE